MPLSPEQKKEYDRQRYINRRRFAIDYLGGKCIKCGSSIDLQIDHIYWHEKVKVFNKLFNGKLNNLINELDKCQLLCFPCHIEKSKGDFTDRKLSGLVY